MNRKDLNIQGMRENWARHSHLLASNMPKNKVSVDNIVVSDEDVIAEQYTMPEGFNVSFCTWDSVDDMMEQCSRMCNGKVNHTKWAGKKGFTWDSGSYTHHKDTLSKGVAPTEEILNIYQELRDVVDAKFVSVPMEKMRSRKRKRNMTWAGGSVNMARYNEMMNTGRIAPCFNGLSKRADRPVIKIGLNCAMSWSNSDISFARISSMCAVICDKMEEMGYGVEVYGVFSGLTYNTCLNHANGMKKKNGTWDEYWMVDKWLIKSGDEPLDVQRVLSHGMSGLLRLWGFMTEFFCHGASNPSSTSANDCPPEVVKEAGLDILIEKSWSRSSNEENADRIVGLIEELIGTPSPE